MARKTKTVTVGEDTYQLTQLGAVEAHDLYNDLVAALGPKLKELVPQLAELAKLEELPAVQVGLLVVELKTAIPKALMRELRSAFMRTTRVDKGGVFLDLGAGDIFDQHFAGRMGAIDQWMVECAKHNFAGFLGDSGSSSGSLQVPTASE